MKNEKSRKTKLERYGDENYVNKEKISESHKNNWSEHKEERIKKVKETKLERYGDKNYVNKEKIKETQIKKYGSVENAYLHNSIKTKQTKLEKYGDETYVNVEKAKQTKLERYGDENYTNHKKAEETNIEKYGVKVPTQNKEISVKISKTLSSKSDEEWKEIVNKRKQTKLERYGDENYVNAEQSSKTWNSKSQNEISNIVSKSKKTKLEKYGDENYVNMEKFKEISMEKFGTEYFFQSEEVKEKIRQSNLKNLGVEYPMQNKDVQEKVKRQSKAKLLLAKSRNLLTISDLVSIFHKDEHTLFDAIEKLNIDVVRFESDNRVYIKSSDLPILEDYFSKTEMSGKSYSEKELLDYIKSIYKGEIIENTKQIISPRELDIYIPNKNLAIEFDGLYWHDENHVENNYHWNKTKLCNEKEIDLIHIFEDDWVNKKEIVKSMISSRLGIYQQKIFARKCKIEQIEKSQTESFFNENHLQGFAQGNLYLGLFYNNELVQAVIINKKGWHDGNVELTRMVTKINIQVIGGFSKLMKHISDYIEYEFITSYVYRAWFNGRGYLESGFKIIGENKPSYSYIVDNKRIHKSMFRKDKIKRYFENGTLEYFNENETEHELMEHNMIYRIYDCGTIKVVYKKE